MQEPSPVLMGTSREWVTCNKEVPKLVEIPHNGYVIDLISSLTVKEKADKSFKKRLRCI